MCNKQTIHSHNDYNPMYLNNFPAYFQSNYPLKHPLKIVYNTLSISILIAKYHRDDSIAKQLPNSKRQRNNFKSICQPDIFALRQVRLAPQFCLYTRKMEVCECVLITEHSTISRSKTVSHYHVSTIYMIVLARHDISPNLIYILVTTKFQFDKAMNIKPHSLRDTVPTNSLLCRSD